MMELGTAEGISSMAEVSQASRQPARWGRLTLACVAAIAIGFALVRRPLTAPLPNTVQIADMTWVEVRSAIVNGYTTVIVPSGGVEQNGPHMVLGKHNYIVQWAAKKIAAELSRTLVAPVVPFVPEGGYDPPEGHLRFPGTIGVSEQAYTQVLEGVARSLKAGGFTTICFIADHGGSLKPQAEVAARLAKEWAQQGVRVIDVSDYYADEAQTKLLEAQGETSASIGQHAGITDSSELLAAHPEGVDLSRFANAPFSFESNGVSGDPMKASAERGRALLDLKVKAAVRQIRALAGGADDLLQRAPAFPIARP
jgi:creatinine amidohydrolase/Fe(II)-dependent formamide hydrolase-like protein